MRHCNRRVTRACDRPREPPQPPPIKSRRNRHCCRCREKNLSSRLILLRAPTTTYQWEQVCMIAHVICESILCHLSMRFHCRDKIFTLFYISIMCSCADILLRVLAKLMHCAATPLPSVMRTYLRSSCVPANGFRCHCPPELVFYNCDSLFHHQSSEFKFGFLFCLSSFELALNEQTQSQSALLCAPFAPM